MSVGGNWVGLPSFLSEILQSTRTKLDIKMVATFFFFDWFSGAELLLVPFLGGNIATLNFWSVEMGFVRVSSPCNPVYVLQRHFQGDSPWMIFSESYQLRCDCTRRFVEKLQLFIGQEARKKTIRSNQHFVAIKSMHFKGADMNDVTTFSGDV